MGGIPRLKAIDLFAGCGGLTSGLQAAGFDVVAAVEIDSDAAKTYRANHPKVRLYEKDIRRVSASKVLRDLGLKKGEIDLIAGCPPCQGFTRLTERSRRRDPRNQLVREYLRFVRKIRPRACMLENVPGLRTRGKRLFNELLKGLRRAGYVINSDVLELADFGVPQLRKRLVLLAGFGFDIAIPKPTHQQKSAKHPWRTVRNAIGRLSTPPRRSDVVAGRHRPANKWHVARDVAPIVRRRLAHALKKGANRTALPPSLRLDCHERRPDGYYDVYGVMSWDSPSPTMTSGCTNASKGCFGHPEVPRPLTAWEAARLQTFPSSYRFKGSGVESVARQIGNALPRRFAKVVGRAVANELRQRSPQADGR